MVPENFLEMGGQRTKILIVPNEGAKYQEIPCVLRNGRAGENKFFIYAHSWHAETDGNSSKVISGPLPSIFHRIFIK